MTPAESSLEKARAAAEKWLNENWPKDESPPFGKPELANNPGYEIIHTFERDQLPEILAAYTDSAVALEREQCAKIAESCINREDGLALAITQAIRARGERKAGENG